jgi:hypothetical protein
MRSRFLAAATAATLLAACGSVTDSVGFHVPSHYETRVSFGPFMQIWSTPDERSTLMLMQFPTNVDINKALNSAEIKDAKIEKREKITICGNQAADFAHIVGTTSTDIKIGVNAGKSTTRASNIDFLATAVNGKTYFALYVWPLKDAPNPESEAALRGVCAK